MARTDQAATAAIVLAGGEARRLGGRSKPNLIVGGRRLLDIVLDATAGASPQVVVAGPEVAVPDGVLRVQEQPPRSGPAAGILAGLQAVRQVPGGVPEWALILACDLPGAAGVVERLRASIDDVPTTGAGADGAILAHPDGTREWLAAVLRTDALESAGHALGSAVDRSVRSLLGRLSLTEVSTEGLETADIDTPDDHARAEALQAKASRPPVSASPAYTTTLLPWIRQACAAVDADPGLVDVDRLHLLTGEVARGVERSMAPISAFIVGVGLARGDRTLEELCALVEATLPAAEGRS